MVVLTMAVNFLAACSDWSDGDLTSVKGSSGERSNVVLSDIVGIWEVHGIDIAPDDVRYVSITDDGTLLGFNYLGDTADQGSDCYDIKGSDVAKIKLLADSEGFVWNAIAYQPNQFDYDIDVSLEGGGDSLSLTLKSSTANNLEVDRSLELFRRADLSEESMVPLCPGASLSYPKAVADSDRDESIVGRYALDGATLYYDNGESIAFTNDDLSGTMNIGETILTQRYTYHETGLRYGVQVTYTTGDGYSLHVSNEGCSGVLDYQFNSFGQLVIRAPAGYCDLIFTEVDAWSRGDLKK